MAKTNFRHEKRQKEMARKLRQAERLARRGERPAEESAGAPPPAIVKDETSSGGAA